MKTILVVVVLGWFAPSALAQTCFESDPLLAVAGDHPIQVELGDFDADGDLDLGTFDALSYGFTTRRNNGDGTWGVATQLPVNNDTRRFDFLDVDGDGRADLVYTGDFGTLIIRRSLGNSFAAPTTYSVPGNVVSLAGGDLDNDGDLDLVVGATWEFLGTGMARILRNQGGGSFVVEAGILASVHTVKIVDFDVDGDQDILMAVYGANHFRVAVNDGTGQFPGNPYTFAQSMNVNSFTIADFDGDGRADLAAGLVQQRFSIQFSTPDGFTPYVEYSTPYTCGGMTASDLDGDGDVDVTVASGSNVHVFRNAGNGALALAGTLDVGPTYGGTSGDVDGDGDEDLAYTLTWTDQVQVLRNCTVSGFPACFGDGSATACPCGNASPAGARAGCLHSLGTGGTLRASGAASIAADSIVLRGASMPNAPALYFQGTSATNGGLGSVFGDGLRCAGGSATRLGITTNVGGESQFPAAGQPSVSVRGGVTSPGERHYQVWYRNAAGFCTPATFNLTNSLRLAWRL